MTTRMPFTAILVLFATACVAPPPQHQEADTAAVHAEAHHGAPHHGAGTQSVAGFFGGSDEIGDTEGLTFGAGYGYRIGDRWGLGAFAEAVTGLDRSFATGVFLGVNPIGGLVLEAGPGLERHHDEWGLIGRFGVLYDFPLDDHWGIAPSVHYDVSEHNDLIIYGVDVGYSW